jgi:hypothetical protein
MTTKQRTEGKTSDSEDEESNVEVVLSSSGSQPLGDGTSEEESDLSDDSIIGKAYETIYPPKTTQRSQKVDKEKDNGKTKQGHS